MNISFYKYLLRFYLFSMLVLSLLRSIFLLYYYQNAFKTAWAELLHSFCIGFIIDSSVVSITIIISLIISLISGFFSEKSPLIFFRLSFTLICISFFVNLIDIFYFEQFGVRLNQYALQEYQSPKTVLPMIYNEYPVIWIMLILGLFFLLIFSFMPKIFPIVLLKQKG